MGDIIPLIIFTTFAGLAAGAYATSAVLYPYEQQQKRWLFPVVCIMLLGVGLCATFTHLGQPLRFYYGMTHPTSMIAQESYWSIAFGLVMLIDAVIAKVKGSTPRIVRVIGTLFAVGLMIVTGLVYAGCLNYEAWLGIGTVPEFVVGDLAMGMLLYLVLRKIPLDENHVPQMIIVLQVLLGLVTLTLIIHFANVGLGISIPFIISLLIGPVAICVLVAKRHVLTVKSAFLKKNLLMVLFLLGIVSVIVARVAFYAAGIL